MRITEIKQRTISEKYVTGISCDTCQKAILGAHFEVTTHHCDWGKDSGDSFENYDFCYVECMSPHMVGYFKSARGSEQYDIERKS